MASDALAARIAATTNLRGFMNFSSYDVRRERAAQDNYRMRDRGNTSSCEEGTFPCERKIVLAMLVERRIRIGERAADEMQPCTHALNVVPLRI